MELGLSVQAALPTVSARIARHSLHRLNGRSKGEDVMNIAFWLMRTAQTNPRRPALFLGTERVADYGELHIRALALAAALIDGGIRPGDRVAVFMPNVPDYLTALFGAWYAGAIVVPINAKLHPKEAAWILDNSGASLCLSVDAHLDALRGMSTACGTVDLGVEPDLTHLISEPVARLTNDIAWLFYTSGTTGRPKGVEITHRNLISMSLCYQTDVDVVRPDHAAIYSAPMSHGAGLYSMMHVLRSARHVFPVSRGFDPAEILDLAAFHGSVHMFAAPTMVKRLTDYASGAGLSGDGLETIVYAGGPMYEADILSAVDQFGPVFAQIYGQGECPMGITAMPKSMVADRISDGWRGRLNSVGTAQSAVDVRIRGVDGKLAPVGDVGEIEVRGDTVMAGYWNAPDATSAAISKGWLKTGDIGRLDVQGFLTLMDRSKDVIISGGTNIYPREVEDVLLLHHAVSEVSVIGHPSAEWGEDIIAFVVFRDGNEASIEELDAHCINHIARFKRPKVYHVLKDLPKNNYGKVLKTSLRDQAQSFLGGVEPVQK